MPFALCAGTGPFTALTVLSLALGIGANTAIYSFMDAILAAISAGERPGLARGRELAKPRAHTRCARQSRVGHALHEREREPDGEGGLKSGIFPFPAFELLQKESSGVFSSLFAYHPAGGLTS